MLGLPIVVIGQSFDEVFAEEEEWKKGRAERDARSKAYDTGAVGVGGTPVSHCTAHSVDSASHPFQPHNYRLVSCGIAHVVLSNRRWRWL